MKNNIPAFLLEKRRDSGEVPAGANSAFIDQGLKRLASIVKSGYINIEFLANDSLIRRIDARIKVLFGLFLIIMITLKRDAASGACILLLIVALALISRLNLLAFVRRAFFFGFLFGFLISLPSSLNLIARGEIILPLFELPHAYNFWIYHIPQNIGFTLEGIKGALMLTLRVTNSVAASYWILCVTPFPDIIRVLKVFKAPDEILMIITLTYKYVFIFAKTVEDMYLAMRSRMAGPLKNGGVRDIMAGRIAFVFKKTQARCEDLFKAMLARGFHNGSQICGFDKMQAGDKAAAGCFALAAAIIAAL